VKSAYKFLVNQDIGPSDGVFKQLWQVKVLPNVLTTAWRFLLDRMPTRLNLIRRGVVVSSSICVLSKPWKSPLSTCS